MVNCSRVFAALIVFFLIHSNSSAQSYRKLERLQLLRSWVNTAQINPARGGIGSIVVSVNHDPEQATSVFVVDYDGGKIQFSESDLGPVGGLLGVDEAKRLAEKEVIRKESLGLKPQLKTVKVPPVSLFLSSTSGLLQNFDAETGREIWSVSLGNPRYPTSAAGANDNYVSVVNGSTLYVLSRKTGETKLERRLTTNPMMTIGDIISGPIATADWIFVPCLGGQMEAYSLENVKDSTLEFVRKPWLYRSNGRISGRPIQTPTLIAWTTDAGRLLASKVEDPEIQFRFDTSSRVSGQPAFSNGHIFVASENGFLFAIDIDNETISWEVSTGEPLFGSPAVIGDDIFVRSLDDKLICLGATDGIRKWATHNTRRLLSVSATRVYVNDQLGTLKVLDRATGRLLSATGMLTDFAIENYETDRLYLATRSGRLFGYRELNSEFPVVHNPVQLAETKEPEKKPTDAPAVTPADSTFGIEIEPDAEADKPEDMDDETEGDDANSFGFEEEADEAATDDDTNVEDDVFDFGGDE